MNYIKKFCNFLIFGKISLGHKEQEIVEEIVTEENSISYHYTNTKLKMRDRNPVCNNNDEAKSPDESDLGYMAMMFPFSPPCENNMPSVKEICDYGDERKHWLKKVNRKRGLMIPEDESPFKKHKRHRHAEYKFTFVLTVNSVTRSNISLAEPPTRHNRRVRVFKRPAPYHIPTKRRIEL